MPLEQFVTLQRGHDLTESERSPGSVPVIGSAGVHGFHSEATTPAPGVTVGRSGASAGNVCFSSVDYWAHNTVLYVTDFHGNDQRFAYFLLKWLDLGRYAGGSAQQTLNRNHVHPIAVHVPPLAEQKAIADTLGAFDDKIDLNRRMNETLEDMARAIFKSWFVDFDPVHAKMEGRQPVGMDADTAALFPDEFEDSELGEIPKGWEAGTFGDLAQQMRRVTQPDEVPPGTAYVGLEHMPRRSTTLSEWGVAEEVSSGKHAFRRGEILFGKLRPYFHKVGIALVDGICSTDILVLSPMQQEWFGFVLGHVSSDQFIAYADATSTGTKMPRSNWASLAAYAVAIPPDAIADAYDRIVGPFADVTSANVAESKTLSAIRDTLLPKLMSGELRLPLTEGNAGTQP